VTVTPIYIYKIIKDTDVAVRCINEYGEGEGEQIPSFVTSAMDGGKLSA
jgi:hypothetical protein